MTNHPDIVNEAAKAAPAVTVGGLTLFGVGLSDWVLLATLIYTVLQVVFLLRVVYAVSTGGSPLMFLNENF